MGNRYENRVFFKTLKKKKEKRGETEIMARELLHYALVYLALVVAWVPLMDFFNQSFAPTVIAGGVVFVVADQLAHKFLLGEKFIFE